MISYSITPHNPCGTTIRALKLERRIYDWFKWGHATHTCSIRTQTTAHDSQHMCVCGFTWKHFSPFI